jgi:hypothetical protein
MAKKPLAVRRPATLSAYKPSVREQTGIIGEDLFKKITGRDPGYEARDAINRYAGLLDMFDVPGAVMSADDLRRSLASRRYGDAVADAAGLAVGLIPMAGGVLKGGAKRAVKKGVEGAADLVKKYADDVLPNNVMTATYEYRPGVVGGHATEFSNMTPSEQREYGMIGHWAKPTGPKGEYEDIGYKAVNIPQLPTVEIPGLYTNSLGKVEKNIAYGGMPFVEFDAEGKVDPLLSKKIRTMERHRGLMDGQEASAANVINTDPSLGDSLGALIDTGGVQLTSNQLERADNIVSKANSGYGVSATSRGASIFPYVIEGASPKDLSDLITSSGNALREIVPNSKLTPGVPSTEYVPAFGKFDDDYNIVATTPYSGEATHADLQGFADLPLDFAEDLGASADYRAAIREKYLRDLPLPSARGDLQNTRRFFIEADWPRAVELMKKGFSATAALAALGYASSSLADTPED